MKFRFLQITIQLSIISTFFFNSFNYHLDDGTRIPITGFEALLKNEYWIVGNLLIWLILIISVVHLITQIVASVNPKIYNKIEQSLTAAIIIELVAGLLVVTLLGTYLELLGMIMIGFVVLGTYVKYKFDL
jgi:hypothetical protein